MIDGSNVVRAILTGDESIDLKKISTNDLRALDDLIGQLKFNVVMDMLLDDLEFDEGITNENEEYSKIIEEKIAKLNEQLEYLKSRKELDGIPSSLRPDMTFTASKIEKIEEEIKKYKKVLKKVSNPREFIESFIHEYFCDNPEYKKQEERYDRIMRTCAYEMAYGYFDMEHSRVSPKHEQLFSVERKDGEEVFIPNPEAITDFIELIRNDSLVVEIDKQRELQSSVRINKKNANELKNRVRLLKNVPFVLEKYYEELEALLSMYVNSIIDINNMYDEEYKLSSRIIDMENKSIMYRLFRKRSAAIEAKSDELSSMNVNNDSNVKKKTAAIVDAYEELIRNKEFDETLRFIISESKGNISVNKNDPIIKSLEESYGGMNNLQYLLAILNMAYKKNAPVIDTVADLTSLYESLASYENRFENANALLATSLVKSKENYESLSETAQKMLGKNINIFGLRERYVDLSGNTRYGVKPFICSLMLELLITKNDIKTIDDLKKLGISFTEEELDRYKAVRDSLKDDFNSYLHSSEETPKKR